MHDVIRLYPTGSLGVDNPCMDEAPMQFELAYSSMHRPGVALLVDGVVRQTGQCGMVLIAEMLAKQAARMALRQVRNAPVGPSDAEFRDVATQAIRDLLGCLPMRRDWLDPVTEKVLRKLAGGPVRTGPNEFPSPSSSSV